MPRSRIKRGKKNQGPDAGGGGGNGGGGSYTPPPPAPQRDRGVKYEQNSIGIGAKADLRASEEEKAAKALAREMRRNARQERRQANRQLADEVRDREAALRAADRAGDKTAQRAVTVEEHSKFFNERLRRFDPVAVRLAPGMVFKWAARSNMPQEELDKQARSFNAITPWVMGKNTFADGQGALAAARSFALATDNKHALWLLDAISQLPKDQQEAIILQLRNPYDFSQYQETLQTPTVEMAAEQDALAPLVKRWGLDIRKDPETGEVIYAVDEEDPQAIQVLLSLRALFPNSAQVFQLSGPDLMSRVVTRPLYYASHGFNQTMQAGDMFGEWFAKTLTSGIKSGATALNRWTFGEVTKEDQRRIAGVAGTPVKLYNDAFKAFDGAIRTAVEPALKLMMDEESEDYEETLTAVSGLIEIFIFRKAGKLAGAYMKGFTHLPSEARAMLDIDVGALETNYGGSFTGRLNPETPLGKFAQSAGAHPLRFVDNLVKRAGYNISPWGNDLAGFVENSGIMRGALDTIDDINTKYSTLEERVAHIRAVTRGKVPIELAKRLAQAPREAMGRIFIDYSEKSSSPHPQARATAQRATSEAVRAQEAARNARVAKEDVIRLEKEATSLRERSEAIRAGEETGNNLLDRTDTRPKYEQYETEVQPGDKVIYHGRNPEQGPKAAGDPRWDDRMFGADRETAESYAGENGQVTRIRIKQDSKGVVEGTGMFDRVKRAAEHFRRDQNIQAGTATTEGLTPDGLKELLHPENETFPDDPADWSAQQLGDFIERAEAMGFDYAEFKNSDLGTAIINQDVMESTAVEVQPGRSLRLVDELNDQYNDIQAQLETARARMNLGEDPNSLPMAPMYINDPMLSKQGGLAGMLASAESLTRFQEPGYLYHVANADAIEPIRETGLEPNVRSHREHKGDVAEGLGHKVRAWEDGYVDTRAYLDPELSEAYVLANQPNTVALRIRSDLVKTEGGLYGEEVFTRERIRPEDMEYLGADGKWYRLKSPDPAELAATLNKLEGTLDKLALAEQERRREGQVDARESEATDLEAEAQARGQESIDAYKRYREAKHAERDARLQHLAEQERLGRMAGDQTNLPVYEYPRINRLKAVIWGDAHGHLGKMIDNVIVKPARKLGFDLYKTVDELPTYPILHSPGDPSRPADWREQNVDTISKVLRRAGVPDELANRLSGELGLLETVTDFQAWNVRFRTAVGLALPDNTPSHIRANWMGMTDGIAEPIQNYAVPVTREHSDGTPYPGSEPVLPAREGGGALPSSPTEFQGSLHLPDVDSLIEATSVFQRGLRWSRENLPAPLSFRIPEALRQQLGPDAPQRLSALDFAYHIPKFALKFGTLAWKAPILALRIPAMMQRIQMEQALRARLYGGYRGTTFFPGGVHMNSGQLDGFARLLGAEKTGMGYQLLQPDPRFGGFSRPEDVDLGSIHTQLTEEGGRVVAWHADMRPYNSRTLVPQDAHFLAAAQTYQRMRRDPVDRVFLEEGMDPDAFLARMDADENLRRYVYTEQLPMIKESKIYNSGMDDATAIRAWLDRKRLAMSRLTTSDPVLGEALRTGFIRPDRKLRTSPHVDQSSGAPLTDNILENLENQRSISGRIRTISESPTPNAADSAVKRVLEERLRELRNKQFVMEQKAGVLAEQLYEGKGSINVDHTQRLARHLRSEYEAGRYNFPDQLRVQRRYAWEDSHSLYEGYRAIRRTWNKAWYAPYQVLSWADMKGTRGSMYYQIAEDTYRDLTSRGYNDLEARAFSQVRAAEQVRDVMYDLSARTSLQKSLQDVFWFGPAMQEIAYTWLVKIPAQSGGLGLFTIPAQAKAFINVMESQGIITTDREGEGIIPIPSVAALVDLLVPGEQRFEGMLPFVKTEGFNMVSSNPFPSLSTLPAKGLAEAGRRYGGMWQSLSQMFNQYGADITSTPRQMVYAWEAATGNKFPLEFMSPDYAKRTYDRAMDQALQIAMAQRIEGGVNPPRVENFETIEDYWDARDRWLENTMGEARSIFKGIALQRLVGSSLTPASVYIDSKEEEAYRVFWDKFVDPAGNEEKTGTYSEKQRDLIDEYIAQHPQSLAYSIAYTTYGEKQRELPYVPVGDQAFFEEFYTGERRVLSPEDYVQKLMTIESYRYYQHQRAEAIGGIDQDLTSYLMNGDLRTAANTDLNERWNDFLSANPDAKAIMDESKRQWEARYGVPHETFEQERLSDAIQLLNELSPVFTGEGGLRAEEFRKTLGKLKATLATEGTFGEPTTALGKQLGEYYDTVMDPYFESTEGLYEKALQMTQRGEFAGDVYAQIQAINDELYANPPTLSDGTVVPTPEEVFFGNKPQPEKDNAIVNWVSKPAEWLTEFQLSKTGIYPEFEGRNEMLTRMNDATSEMYDIIREKDIASSSDAYTRVQRQAEEKRRQIAAEYGPEGTAIFELTESAPIGRIMASGIPDRFPQARGILEDTAEATEYVTGQIEKADLSPSSYSELATKYKLWLFRQIESERAHSEQYDRMWAQLGRAIPEKGYVHREGVPLYDAILFNNFNSDFIPPDFVAAVYGRNR